MIIMCNNTNINVAILGRNPVDLRAKQYDRSAGVAELICLTNSLICSDIAIFKFITCLIGIYLLHYNYVKQS